MQIKKVSINRVKEWEKNPRGATKEDLNRLRKQIDTLGVYKPLIATSENGFYTVLGGNKRLQVLKERGDEKVMLSLVNAPDDKTKMEYALSDNDQVGYYIADKLVDLIEPIKDDIDLKNFKVDLKYLKPLDLQTVLEMQSAPKPEKGFVIFSKDEIIDRTFEYFREKGFPYRNLPLHVCMQQINYLAQAPEKVLLNTNVGYQVADTFHPHRFECRVGTKPNVIETFGDDNRLKKAIELALDTKGEIGINLFPTLGIVRGTQMCSNFRPGYACYIYKKYGKKDGIAFDPSMGYGGRLLGWFASNMGGSYVGTDPNIPTYKANLKIAETFKFVSRVDLYSLQVEEFNDKRYANSVDLVFTSPPYFKKEIYCEDETQSCNKYNDLKQWVDGFLDALFLKSYNVLKKNRFFVLNIENIRYGKEVIALVDIAKEVARSHKFKYVDIEYYKLHHRIGAHQQEEQVQESVLIFKKV